MVKPRKPRQTKRDRERADQLRRVQQVRQALIRMGKLKPRKGKGSRKAP